MPFIIENTEIGLSYTLQSEIPLITEAEQHSDNKVFISPYTVERHLEVINNKDEAHLTIRHKQTGEPAGFIILAGLENQNLSLEFRRIVILSKGQGLGRQSLQLVKQFCFNTLKFHRLWLDVFEDNQRAIHIYKSEGFKEEGRLRDIIKQGETYRTLIVLSILESEFAA